jgi:hypothetical protein
MDELTKPPHGNKLGKRDFEIELDFILEPIRIIEIIQSLDKNFIKLGGQLFSWPEIGSRYLLFLQAELKDHIRSQSLTILLSFFCKTAAFPKKTHRFSDNIHKRAVEFQHPFRRF